MSQAGLLADVENRVPHWWHFTRSERLLFGTGLVFKVVFIVTFALVVGFLILVGLLVVDFLLLIIGLLVDVCVGILIFTTVLAVEGFGIGFLFVNCVMNLSSLLSAILFPSSNSFNFSSATGKLSSCFPSIPLHRWVVQTQASMESDSTATGLHSSSALIGFSTLPSKMVVGKHSLITAVCSLACLHS